MRINVVTNNRFKCEGNLVSFKLQDKHLGRRINMLQIKVQSTW